MKVSEKIRAPKNAAKKDAMQGIEQTLVYSLGKLQVDFTLFRMRYLKQKQARFSINKYRAMFYINLQLTPISKFLNPL